MRTGHEALLQWTVSTFGGWSTSVGGTRKRSPEKQTVPEHEGLRRAKVVGFHTYTDGDTNSDTYFEIIAAISF